jgi:hypothetical protein
MPALKRPGPRKEEQHFKSMLFGPHTHTNPSKTLPLGFTVRVPRVRVRFELPNSHVSFYVFPSQLRRPVADVAPQGERLRASRVKIRSGFAPMPTRPALARVSVPAAAP